MKRTLIPVAPVLILCLAALCARAQPVGLPVADLAEEGVQYEFEFAGGVALGTDTACAGLRETYSIRDELRVFGDIVAVDTDHGDTDMGLQVGLLTPMPVDFLADLALRGTVYLSDMDELDMYGGTAMIVASGWTALNPLAVYAGLGLDLRQDEYQTPGAESTRHTGLNPIATVGALVRISEHFSAYAELMQDDEIMVSVGVRAR